MEEVIRGQKTTRATFSANGPATSCGSVVVCMPMNCFTALQYSNVTPLLFTKTLLDRIPEVYVTTEPAKEDTKG